MRPPTISRKKRTEPPATTPGGRRAQTHFRNDLDALAAGEAIDRPAWLKVVKQAVRATPTSRDQTAQEDLLQEAILKLMHLRKTKAERWAEATQLDEARLRRWLSTFIRNLAIDAARGTQGREAPPGDGLPIMATSGGEEFLRRRLDGPLIARILLSGLSPCEALALKWHLNDLTLEETARRLDVSVTTAHAIRERARSAASEAMRPPAIREPGLDMAPRAGSMRTVGSALDWIRDAPENQLCKAAGRPDPQNRKAPGHWLIPSLGEE